MATEKLPLISSSIKSTEIPSALTLEVIRAQARKINLLIDELGVAWANIQDLQDRVRKLESSHSEHKM